MAQPIRRLRIAVSGLGRMGARHALHFLHRTPKAELVAAFTPDDKEAEWARSNLEPWGIKIYRDYDEMLTHSRLEAVCVATVTTAHADQAIKAIEAGKHVLCEKPFSTQVDVCEKLFATAARHPHVKLMCGFSRRFDASYRAAHARTLGGEIGRPTILRSQTCDMAPADWTFFVEYSKHSGGIFVDCAIHDIDLALWFFSTSGALPKPKSVVAFGVTALQPALAAHGDVDNGVGVVEFWGGQIAYFYASRMNAPGQHDMTEIIGTAGKLVVNGTPATDLLEAHLPGGVQRGIPQNYYERFEHAFVAEAREFTDAVLEGREVPVDIASSVEAVRIAGALQESLREGRKIAFDEEGKRVEGRARL